MATKKNWEENRPRSREKTITGDKNKTAKVEIGTDERKHFGLPKARPNSAGKGATKVIESRSKVGSLHQEFKDRTNRKNSKETRTDAARKQRELVSQKPKTDGPIYKIEEKEKLNKTSTRKKK